MSWWKTAKPGDKVVCIEGYSRDYLCKVHAGGVYTVDEIWPSNSGMGIVVSFIGLRKEGGGVFGFAVERFRPVQTKSTDTGMAILKRILERPEQRIEEDAW